MTPSRFDPFTVPLTGTNVVTASAGTGKTYAITALALRLLLESRLDVRELLVVTFTEAATAELRARIRARLRDAAESFAAVLGGKRSGDIELDAYAERRRGTASEDLGRLEAALRDVDLAAISTIHGFCYRMVQESAFESDARFDAELVTDLGALRDQVVHDFWAEHFSRLPRSLIRELQGAEFNVRAARNLTDRAVRSPDLVILPEGDETAFRGAFERARAVWRASRETFGVALLTHPKAGAALKKSKVDEWAGTIDAFFEHPYAGPGTGLPLGIRKAFSEEHWADSPPPHPFAEHADRLVSVSTAKYLNPRVVAVQRDFVSHARRRLPELTRRAGVISFDDLLLILDGALSGPLRDALVRAVRSRFRAALIDEFQDTDPVQFRIFDTIYGQTAQPLFLIGDPKQAIYGFRGADVFAYLSAVSRPGCLAHTMDVSYRSDPGLVRAVNALFEPQRGRPRPFIIPGIEPPRVAARPGAENAFVAPAPFSLAPLEFLFCASDPGEEPLGKTFVKERLPGWIAADISALVRSQATVNGIPVTPGDIAVLTRTNSQCFEVQDALRALRIPAVVLGDETVFGRPEAQELQRVFGAIVEPSAHELRRAVTTELLGVTANDLAAMDTEPARWDEWASRFREWNALWTERGFVQMFHAMLSGARVQERLLRLSDGERRMTNLLHLMELLHTATKESHLGPAGLLHWLSVQRTTEHAGGEAAEIRLESDDRAVKLTTIHKSKGLEYPVVYCPYLWDGMLLHPNDRKAIRFHDETDHGRLKLDLGSDHYFEHRDRAELEALAENLRLLYVALTRAKHRCTVFWGRIAEADASALFSVLHPPELEEGAPVSIREWKDRLGAVPETAMRAAILALSEKTGSAIGLRELSPDAEALPLQPATDRDRPLGHRKALRDFDRLWGVASFSGLTRARATVSLDEAEGRDKDEQADVPLSSASPKRPVTRTPSVLADFPRGAKAGTFYHSLLEHLDFQAPEQIPRLVERALPSGGYDSSRWAAPLCQSLADVLATPLQDGPSAPRLLSVPRSRRKDELEFHLPVASAHEGRSAALSPKRLAEVFSRHPIDGAPNGYPDALADLPFLPVEGFLKGYVDLVFEHDGRFFVVDYKTNRLGDAIEDYAAQALPAAMAHGHYYLQYHLYTLAVHRYLARRVPGYSYATHFGGVLYLFVKGMTEETGPSSGVFFEKPPEARLNALSRALGRGNAARVPP